MPAEEGGIWAVSRVLAPGELDRLRGSRGSRSGRQRPIPPGRQGCTRQPGQFPYAEHALDYWLPRLDELASVDEPDLPPTLDAIYGLFLEREFGAEPGRTTWKGAVAFAVAPFEQ
jgi:hypothetical protein